MAEPAGLTISLALQELKAVAPGVPLLALGQTIYWDEPMKAGVALEASKLGMKFIGGVHDTDYFAKNPSGQHHPKTFTTVSHNDGSTRGLWSAAGEFSQLFGSETVITRDALAKAGLKLERLEQSRPDFLDVMTEAWGWRGIVSMDENPPITNEVRVEDISKELCKTLDWALNSSAETLSGKCRTSALEKARELHDMLCREAENLDHSVSSLYRALMPRVYNFVAGREVSLETAQTTELLRLNSATMSLPRFDILRLFVEPSTRRASCDAYNESLKGAPGIYDLSRFGTGAIPFDLVVPGLGRGTIRLGTRGAVIMTRKPLFLTFKKPITTFEEFVEVLESKFGPNCTVVGKAVALIGQLAREFVFVFHEGASSYVKYSKVLHQRLNFKVHPLLRVRYETWDSLDATCAWIKLPPLFVRPFGIEEVNSPSFAATWRRVRESEQALLETLGQLRRPIELIRFLERTVGGTWISLANEYMKLQKDLERVKVEVDQVRAERGRLYDAYHAARARQNELEMEKGVHFREKVFEKPFSEDEQATRENFECQIEENLELIRDLKAQLTNKLKNQSSVAHSEFAIEAHARRRAIELEAELKRMRLIQEAITCWKGLASSNRRPSAWWLPLVSPSGKWFNRIMETAEAYLEPLV